MFIFLFQKDILRMTYFGFVSFRYAMGFSSLKRRISCRATRMSIVLVAGRMSSLRSLWVAGQFFLLVLKTNGCTANPFALKAYITHISTRRVTWFLEWRVAVAWAVYVTPLETSESEHKVKMKWVGYSEASCFLVLKNSVFLLLVRLGFHFDSLAQRGLVVVFQGFFLLEFLIYFVCWKICEIAFDVVLVRRNKWCSEGKDGMTTTTTTHTALVMVSRLKNTCLGILSVWWQSCICTSLSS